MRDLESWFIIVDLDNQSRFEQRIALTYYSLSTCLIAFKLCVDVLGWFPRYLD